MTIRSGRCRLKSILKTKRMTQTELANLTKLTPQRISDYANDRLYMSIINAVRIAKALDVPIE